MNRIWKAKGVPVGDTNG